MTKVKIFKFDNYINKIEIAGHAMSAQSGKDLVCAGISTVVIGVCNSLDILSNYDTKQIVISDGYVVIPNLLIDEKVQLICNVLVVQLEMIKENYPKYIEISYL